MFELEQEEVLMSSSDNLITLTTHRIIHKADKGKEQVMLNDYVSYELKKNHIGNYRILTICFLITTIWLSAWNIYEYFQYREILKQVNLNFLYYLFGFPANLSFLFVGISFCFQLISRRYIVRINGKYNHFEFRVRSLKRKSLLRFLEVLAEQSDKMKKCRNDS
jgi:hypothetical protein